MAHTDEIKGGRWVRRTGEMKMSERTVEQAEREVAALTGDAAKVALLVAACLNAEAALHMLGFKSPERRTGFLPVGVQSLVEIEKVLAEMPDEAALVKDSTAFPCEGCGSPAETSSDDCWWCDGCIAGASVDAA